MSSNVPEAKRRLPLPALMQRLGLCEHAKKSAKCPFHEDTHNSFSVWQNGAWFFKCHAGCGEGDEINFLELHKHLSRSGATKLFLEMAGVNGSKPNETNRSETKPRSVFDWQECVQDFTDKHIEQLAKWRGYSIEFCSWLKQSGLVGLHDGCIAFPVPDHTEIVAAVHYRLKNGSWRYYPQGAKVRPLVIGELLAGDPVHVFESQWDAFAFIDVSGERSGSSITRGASNGALLSGLIPEGATVYLWTQNDVAGEKWQENICANTKALVKRVRIPASHKDLNEWTRAGAEANDLLEAILAAEVIHQAATSKSEASDSLPTAPVQLFPLHCLPPVIEAMANAVCVTERVPESLAGCCALGILSASIGAGLRIQSGPNRVTRGNLYILASAESGSGKSETFRHLARPFLRFDADRVEAWKAEHLPFLLAEKGMIEVDVARIKKQAASGKGDVSRDELRSELQTKLAALEDVENKLRPPALYCEDVTTEKLAMLLAHNGEQIASLSADAGAIVNVLLGRYSKLDRTDEGIYLKAFSGDVCRVDRKTSEPVLLQSPCLAALWLTQPDKLESLLAERSLTDGGLIPRLNACHTHCDAREICEDAPAIPASVSIGFDALICDLLETYRLASEPFLIHPTHEALQAMNAHHNAIVKRRRCELRDVTSFAARWNEQAWRIAVCLHAAEHGFVAHDHPLELATAQSAMELSDWFASQQLEILSAGRHTAQRKIRDEVLALLADTSAGIRASDVYRARIVGNADAAHSLLATMETEGELTAHDDKPESGGHVTRIYTRARK